MTSDAFNNMISAFENGDFEKARNLATYLVENDDVFDKSIVLYILAITSYLNSDVENFKKYSYDFLKLENKNEFALENINQILAEIEANKEGDFSEDILEILLKIFNETNIESFILASKESYIANDVFTHYTFSDKIQLNDYYLDALTFYDLTSKLLKNENVSAIEFLNIDKIISNPYMFNFYTKNDFEILINNQSDNLLKNLITYVYCSLDIYKIYENINFDVSYFKRVNQLKGEIFSKMIDLCEDNFNIMLFEKYSLFSVLNLEEFDAINTDKLAFAACLNLAELLKNKFMMEKISSNSKYMKSDVLTEFELFTNEFEKEVLNVRYFINR